MNLSICLNQKFLAVYYSRDMPIDASDRLRRLQEITQFGGYVNTQAKANPGVNVSTCSGFYGSSNIRNFPDYATKYALEDGRQYFSTALSLIR
jgi:hypothetical protein